MHSLTNQSVINHDLLEQLFDHTPDIAFFIKDSEGRYTTVNHSIVERHGFKTKSQMIGCRPYEICPGELGNLLTEQDSQVLRSGRPILDRLELHWYSPNIPGWCLTTKLPIFNDSSKVIGIIGISKDVRAPVAVEEIPDGVAAALRKLEENFSEPLTPSSLAKLAKLPSTRFARIIKRIFSMTPNHLISKTRLTAAARMLRDSNQSVSEISLACGFSDHSAFTRAFRAATGTSPSDFRKRLNVEG